MNERVGAASDRSLRRAWRSAEASASFLPARGLRSATAEYTECSQNRQRYQPLRCGLHPCGTSSGGLDGSELLVGAAHAALADAEGDGAGAGGLDDVLHLHRLDDEDRRARLDGGALLHEVLGQLARHRAQDRGRAVGAEADVTEAARRRLRAERVAPGVVGDDDGVGGAHGVEARARGAVDVRRVAAVLVARELDAVLPAGALGDEGVVAEARHGELQRLLVVVQQRHHDSGVVVDAEAAGGLQRLIEREADRLGGGVAHVGDGGERGRGGGDGAQRQELVLVLLDELGGDAAGEEGAVLEAALAEVDVGVDARDVVVVERDAEAAERGGAVGAPDDELRDHRVVVDEHLVAAAEAGVEAHLDVADAALLRLAHVGERAAAGEEAVARGLGEDAGLDAVPVDLQVLLREAERLAVGDLDLEAHEVERLALDEADLLGDGVLHLQARVHLHEVEVVAVRVEDELDRAGADVADGLGGADSDLAELLAHLGVEPGRGRLLEHLLVAALHGAVALEEVDAVAVLVAEDLHLDVARALDEALEQHALVLEEVDRLALRALQHRHEVLLVADDLHALATAAAHRLDEQREADALRLGDELLGRLVLTVVSGHDGDAGVGHDVLRLRLGAHGADRGRRRADPLDAGRGDGVGEVGVLGEEAVAGVDALGAGALRDVEDVVTEQVRRLGRRRADAERLVGALDVLAVALSVAVHSDGAEAHRLGGLENAAGDLATVGDEHLAHVARRGCAEGECGTAHHRLGWSTQ
eukprot:CAMPEP_0174878804 /NCGR_PEP_ID=MMETSP1114-20130205/82940_1 /TAXON_ID=312471 /ORGANISM="Neobodo designis, Strain CCAP 1951/1" /LENGTH=759 /DNA_ID=CAMNT_0016114193 /DNA_START=142 /DNA_END=2421 /DNA_ORIENTATION=+